LSSWECKCETLGTKCFNSGGNVDSLPTWDGSTVICGCEWYHPITLVVLLMVAVNLCEKELSPSPPQKNETSLHTTQAKPRKIKMQAEKGYLGLRRRGGEQLGVDLDAVLLPLAPHLRRRPPYHGGRAAPARRLQVSKRNHDPDRGKKQTNQGFGGGAGGGGGGAERG